MFVLLNTNIQMNLKSLKLSFKRYKPSNSVEGSNYLTFNIKWHRYISSAIIIFIANWGRIDAFAKLNMTASVTVLLVNDK